MSPQNARHAVAALFTLHGAIVGTWVPNVPLAKERLDVGPGVFGLALLCAAIGAMIAMPLAGALINRLGSARVSIVAGAGFCAALFLPVNAPTLATFAGGLVVMGACMGSMDVAMNAHGIAVEKRLGRPVMSWFHGMFSLGAAAGAALGALAIKPLGAMAFTLGMQAACLFTLFAAARFLLPAGEDKGLSGSHFAWPTAATIGLGLLCFLALMAEGAILDWAAIHLRQTFALDASTAGLGYSLFSTGMMAARFAGDFLRGRFGSIPLVRWSAALTMLGIAGALVIPSAPLAIFFYAFAGIGIGNLAPVLFAGGGRAEPDAPGRGIAAVTTLGYAGFIAGPAIIGFTAEATGLALALALMIPASLVIALSASAASAADAGREVPA